MAKAELVAATRWKGAYSAVRFNAMTHGIFSKLVVLAHENHVEFDELLAALVEEYKPVGPTQQHLVEEVAAVIWRKRRVLLAEGAVINSKLRDVRRYGSDTVVQAASPLDSGLSGEHSDLSVHMRTPEEVAARAKSAERLRESTWKVVAGILAGGAYGEAVDALEGEPRNWWKDRAEDERDEYPDTAKGLCEYLDAVVLPFYDEIIGAAPVAHAIKAQAYGMGVTGSGMENVCKYETHLDRKLERTLGMLLKLKGMLVA